MVKDTINGERYLRLLQTTVVPEIEASETPLIFQQDNAPPHKTADVRAYLGDQDFKTLEWPPQSPDLSPIETIWNVANMKLKAMEPRPRTPARIRNAMLDIWDSLEEQMRIDLCDSLRDRLRECIRNKGEMTTFSVGTKK
jgi:hypothetical protein